MRSRESLTFNGIPGNLVIDGQQRLTTLQVLFNALHAELRRIDAVVPAGRLEYLIENDKQVCKGADVRFQGVAHNPRAGHQFHGSDERSASS